MTLEIGLKCYQKLFIFCNLSGQSFLYIWRQNFIIFFSKKKYAPKSYAVPPQLQSSRHKIKQGCVGTTGFHKVHLFTLQNVTIHRSSHYKQIYKEENFI